MVAAPPTLWHYTCEHAFSVLGMKGELVPACQLSANIPPAYWWGRLIWMTDLAIPDREALGLTMRITKCDRTEYRYRVTDTADVLPWTRIRRQFPAEVLEGATPGLRPRHWYVAAVPVPVALDPR